MHDSFTPMGFRAVEHATAKSLVAARAFTACSFRVAVFIARLMVGRANISKNQADVKMASFVILILAFSIRFRGLAVSADVPDATGA